MNITKNPNQTVKDTVTTDEENDEVEADDEAWFMYTTICLDSIIHHCIPILTRQDL